MVVFGWPNLTLVEGRIVVGRVGDPQIVDTVAVVLVEGEPRIADDFITEAKRKPVLGPLDPPGQVLDLAAQHHLVPLIRLDIVRRDAEGLLRFGIGRRHISTAHCRIQNATGQRTEIIRSVMDMWTRSATLPRKHCLCVCEERYIERGERQARRYDVRK